MSKQRVITISGPTGTGKSALAVKLAESTGGEIVSADSMQIYKYMDIGTAKPTKDEMRDIPHHMIDIIMPWDNYSVARYVKEASECIDDILRRNKVPLLVGGTGQYIDSLLKGRYFSPRGDDTVRKKYEDEYDAFGGEKMIAKLNKFDPQSAEKLHVNDKKRIVRAMEIFDITGKTITQHDEETLLIPDKYIAVKFALTFSDRADLYKKIDQRVDDMFSKGLVNEVRSLLDMGVSQTNTSMQAIGYKETAETITGLKNTADAVEEIKTESRRYAKRQLTWFRRDAEINWLTWDKSADPDIGVDFIREKLYETK